ncbi:MAG: ATP synthase F1 subunit delta [Bacteroidales bacterium]|nr:ATP synthase F1 subunit delta [Bacteroidales bacterium]
MKVGKIAVRYAKALFLSAREKDVLDAVRDDMELILAAVTDIADIKMLLESTVVETRKKSAILVGIFEGKVNDLVLDFIRLVTGNNREDYLAAISRHYIKLYKEERGIKIASVDTATPLTEELRQEMLALITKAFKAEIELQEKVKKNLIGGFVLRVEDKQLDSSVKGKLARIKKELQK